MLSCDLPHLVACPDARLFVELALQDGTTLSILRFLAEEIDTLVGHAQRLAWQAHHLDVVCHVLMMTVGISQACRIPGLGSLGEGWRLFDTWGTCLLS